MMTQSTENPHDNLGQDPNSNADSQLNGYIEHHLDWMVILRISVMLAIPLFATLFTDALWAKIILWILTLILFWKSVNAWGMSIISVGVILVLSYIFFLWQEPRWVAYIFGAIQVLQISFIRKRVAEIRDLYD